MTQRRILNVASTKKQDTRIQVDLQAGNFIPVGTYAMDPTVITSHLYCPTAQQPIQKNNIGVITDAPNYRATQTCYMRGYSERVRLNITDGRPWTWRRICFTLKGPALTNLALGTDGISVELAPQGYTRPFVRMGTALANGLSNIVMKGTENRDWLNIFDAKVDPSRVTIKSDVTRTVNPGSTQGKTMQYKLWYPMNKNLVYNDDEGGSDVSLSAYSTNGRAGMGDYYIWDLFRCSTSDGAVAGISLGGTLYWHEK